MHILYEPKEGVGLFVNLEQVTRIEFQRAGVGKSQLVIYYTGDKQVSYKSPHADELWRKVIGIMKARPTA